MGLFMACYLPLAVIANLKIRMLDMKRMVLLPFFLAFGYVVALMITCCNVFELLIIKSDSFWKGKRPKKKQKQLNEASGGVEGEKMNARTSPLTSTHASSEPEMGSISLFAFDSGSTAMTGNGAETPGGAHRWGMSSPLGGWHHPESPKKHAPRSGDSVARA